MLWPLIEQECRRLAEIISREHSNRRTKVLTFPGHPRMNETLIEACFLRAFSIGGRCALERVKHLVEIETYDFDDLADLMAALSSRARARVERFFFTAGQALCSCCSRGGNCCSFGIKVVCDIDNTLIEKASTGRIIFPDDTAVPGAGALLLALSGKWSTVSLLTARPNVMERSTLRRFRLQGRDEPAAEFSEKWFPQVSMAGGNLSARNVSALLLTKSHSMRTRLRAYTSLAYSKVSATEQIASLYPRAKIVLVGDDAQGDYIAAALLSHRLKDRFLAAFIRMVAWPGSSVSPRGDMWPSSIEDARCTVIEHSCYFQAISVASAVGGIISVGGMARAQSAAYHELNTRRVQPGNPFGEGRRLED
jgi:hypothetical protein